MLIGIPFLERHHGGPQHAVGALNRENYDPPSSVVLLGKYLSTNSISHREALEFFQLNERETVNCGGSTKQFIVHLMAFRLTV